MTKPVPCILVTITQEAEVCLRRFNGRDCPRGGYHDTRVPLGRMASLADPDVAYRPPVSTPPPEDKRWPSHCRCGYAYLTTDVRQVFHEQLYRAPDGTLSTPRAAPAGWMWPSTWLPWKGPDGLCLIVKLPGGGEWVIDGPANNSSVGWVRTGTPPNLTVRPSIQTPTFHGWLNAGVITST